MNTPVLLALLGSLVTILSTSLGALPALAARRVSEKAQDTLMGFSAGIMLAASSFSLILPALHLAGESAGRLWGAIQVGIFMLGGALFLHLCNRFIPHEHFFTGREGGAQEGPRLKRIWLFVLAITLHNFPEGLAVGTGVGSQDLRLAMPILFGIGLQDLPEGFVVAMALLTVGYRPGQAIGVAVITGLVEGAAALLGYWAVSEMRAILPWALALAGGAMLYVVSDEMIPESHHKEHAKYATAGLMLGFVLMMVLDTALS